MSEIGPIIDLWYPKCPDYCPAALGFAALATEGTQEMKEIKEICRFAPMYNCAVGAKRQ
jgi:hypothetical protein